MKIAGQRLPHESAHGHVTGDALYTDDVAARLPGVLHAWPVMAPHAHAFLTHLDVAPALAEPGVVATLTAADVPGEGDSGSNRRDEPLFPVEIVHHSQAVAWVLGESLEAARLGASRCRRRVQNVARRPQHRRRHRSRQFFTRARSASRAAIRQRSLPPALIGSTVNYSMGGQEHFYLETQAALARLDDSGGVTVESSTQHPSETQEIVARVLGLARNQITVGCLRMGGAFGGKEVQANPWAAIAALGAWKTKRPVRVRLPRKLDMALTGKRHPFLARFSAGFESDGKLRAVRLELYSDGGWSLDLSSPVLWRALFHCDNAYLIPALEARGWVAKTHKTSQTAFRGFGGPQGMIVIEDILDRIARTLGIQPHVVRERNFYREGDVTHYGQPVKDADRIERIWDQIKETSSFDARRGEIARFKRGESARQARALPSRPSNSGSLSPRRSSIRRARSC